MMEVLHLLVFRLRAIDHEEIGFMRDRQLLVGKAGHGKHDAIDVSSNFKMS